MSLLFRTQSERQSILHQRVQEQRKKVNRHIDDVGVQINVLSINKDVEEHYLQIAFQKGKSANSLKHIATRVAMLERQINTLEEFTNTLRQMDNEMLKAQNVSSISDCLVSATKQLKRLDYWMSIPAAVKIMRDFSESMQINGIKSEMFAEHMDSLNQDNSTERERQDKLAEEILKRVQESALKEKTNVHVQFKPRPPPPPTALSIPVYNPLETVNKKEDSELENRFVSLSN